MSNEFKVKNGLITPNINITVPTGTAPMTVASTTPVANLSIGGTAATVTTNANLTGEVTSVGNAATLSNAAVIGKAITGWSASSGALAATDTILLAFGKLAGNLGNNFALFSGPTSTVKTYTLPDASVTLLYSGGALGTPSGGILTNCTFPTLNQDTTGLAGKATNMTGGNNTTLLGQMGYQSALDTTSPISPNTTSTRKFLRQTGTGTNGAAPAWDTILAADVPTLNQATTSSAAFLTTARGIYGNNFDGSAAITAVITSVYGGTGNGWTKFTGPTTAEKTFTLPDASATILTSNALVTVGQGGTGLGTLTSAAVIIGAGTSTPTFVAPGANGNVLTSNGSAWSSAAPSGGGATITDDGSTNTNQYVTFARATSGSLSTAYTDSTSLYQNPSTGVLYSTGYGTVSDENEKKDIALIVNALDIVNGLRGVTYTLKRYNTPSVGLIAQDVEKYFPELVSESEGIRSLNYNGIIGLLVESTKELTNRIKSLEKIVYSLVALNAIGLIASISYLISKG